MSNLTTLAKHSFEEIKNLNPIHVCVSSFKASLGLFRGHTDFQVPSLSPWYLCGDQEIHLRMLITGGREVHGTAKEQTVELSLRSAREKYNHGNGISHLVCVWVLSVSFSFLKSQVLFSFLTSTSRRLSFDTDAFNFLGELLSMS